MVEIGALHPFIPNNPSQFCTLPYDVITPDLEAELKKDPFSLIHFILPDGNGDQKYINAKKAFERYIRNGIIKKVTSPGIFLYRQESKEFSQEGIIVGVSLEDYENNNIVKHEHTRKKPLNDRIKHLTATNVSAGLVWTVIKSDIQFKLFREKIKGNNPIFKFDKYGYRHILWHETSPELIEECKDLFDKKKIYIADGHHRAAAASEYRKIMIEKGEREKEKDIYKPWHYLLTYISSDDEIRIYPYNRVIRNLKMNEDEFLNRIGNIANIQPLKEGTHPNEKHEITMCMKGKWYKLRIKETILNEIHDLRDKLDVSLLQNLILEPILNIKDPRSDENLFFVGGSNTPRDLEKYISERGNDLVFDLYPIDIKDLEKIADSGQVMPPKSTWFDPKLLSGLVLHKLN